MRKSRILSLLVLFWLTPSLWAQQYVLVGSKAKIEYKHSFRDPVSKPIFHKETIITPEDVIITSKSFTIAEINKEEIIRCPASDKNGTKLRNLIFRKTAYTAPDRGTSTNKGEDLNLDRVVGFERSVSPSINFHYLIIGVNEYVDNHWEHLPLPKVNVEKLSKSIEDVMIPYNNFSLHSHCKLLNSGETTKSNIVKRLDELTDSVIPNNNDMVLLYISSHGVKDLNNNFHLIASDSRFDSLSSVPRNTITADMLISYVNKMETKGAKVLCFVDACYSGTIMKDIKRTLGSSVYYMSTANDLVAYEDKNTGSPFARALTRCMSGEEQYFFKEVSDNIVTPENLQDYLFKCVQNERKDQRPVTWRSDHIAGQKLWAIKSSYSFQLDSLMTAAEDGNTDAIVKLGDIFADSINSVRYGVEQSMEVALEFYDWAYGLKNPVAACRLGQYYYYQSVPDYYKAFNYFKVSADNDFNLGIYYLSVCYAKGHGVRKSKKMAKKTLKKLSYINDDITKAFVKERYFEYIEMDFSPFFEHELVRLDYKDGHVTTSIHTFVHSKADDFFYILKKAEKGNAKYQAKLGDIYLNGLFYDPDYDAAYEMYKKAAEQGDKNGLYGLGYLYANGLIGQTDYKKAAEALCLAEQQDLGKACVLCGKLYYNGGYGLEKEERMAVELWKKAAELKDAEGLYLYGLCLSLGTEVPVNKVKAYECYLESAKKGFVEAQYMVGYYLYKGIGIGTDKELAYKWLTKAKNNGHEEAKKLIYKGYYAGGIPKE